MDRRICRMIDQKQDVLIARMKRVCFENNHDPHYAIPDLRTWRVVVTDVRSIVWHVQYFPLPMSKNTLPYNATDT